MPPIKSGIFIMPFHDSAKPLAQCYDEDMELAIRADEMGFDEFWIGEHHTMAYENITMPELFIAAAMPQTKNIHMGPAPVCLQQHHPLHVASRLAMLDHLCKDDSTSASAQAACQPTWKSSASSPRTPQRW